VDLDFGYRSILAGTRPDRCLPIIGWERSLLGEVVEKPNLCITALWIAYGSSAKVSINEQPLAL
jgi:hypothetical protein